MISVLSLVLTGLAVIGLIVVVALRQQRREQPPPSPPMPEPDHRLETLGALAAGIVHEIAQPLSAARVSLEGLHYLRQLGREPSPVQLAHTLDRVGMSLLTMTQIVDHLRFLAGGPTRSQMPLRLGDAVESLVSDRMNWLRWSDVRIDCRNESGAVLALADPTGLRLVLSNLVRNAAEAIAAMPEDRRWVGITVGPGARIEVADPGPGIAPELAARLFTPFISTRGEARGVGLSLAKAAAERMGGTLSFAPREGGGTVFRLELREAGPTV